MGASFDHEKLDAYRIAIEFVRWTGELIDGPLDGCGASAKGQLDRSSTSICLNIAEGNGKRSLRDRKRFLDMARASAFESAACLDVLVARRKLEPQTISNGKGFLVRIVEMLTKWTASLTN